MANSSPNNPNEDLIELLRLRSEQIKALPVYLQPTWEQKLLEKASWLMRRAADELEKQNGELQS